MDTRMALEKHNNGGGICVCLAVLWKIAWCVQIVAYSQNVINGPGSDN